LAADASVIVTTTPKNDRKLPCDIKLDNNIF